MLLSLRRRGQLLLLTCALLGVVAGAGLGMVVEHAATPAAVAAPGRERGASRVAASPPTGQPSGSLTTAPRSRAGNRSNGTRTGLADRAGRHRKTGDGKHDRGRPADRGKGKPGKNK